MLDLLRTQGRNGAVALLESLMIHYPILYTQATGHKPSTEPSRFSGQWASGASLSVTVTLTVTLTFCLQV